MNRAMVIQGVTMGKVVQAGSEVQLDLSSGIGVSM